jgi:DNA modification methylase
MMNTEHHMENAALFLGDSYENLTMMATGSVDCIITSPPYLGLRDYGIEGQIGLEETLEDYIDDLMQVFMESHRVLADDGTFWLNIGDTYGRGSRPLTQPAQTFEKGKNKEKRPQDKRSLHLRNKSLIGVPWKLAFALQDAGWLLRSEIIWHKPNPTPEAIKDRVTRAHETIFMFSKRDKYHFDVDAIKETGVDGETLVRRKDVWSVPTQSYKGAHFATFPDTLIEPMVRAGCKPDGVVLDPFSGSGTTGLVALREGRKYIGIELNPEYLEIQRGRLGFPEPEIYLYEEEEVQAA